MPETKAIPTPAALRAEFERLVLRDLLGPTDEHEEVDEASVSDRYLAGMLAPRRNPVGGELLEGLEVGGKDSGEEGKTDITAPQSETLIPCSFGLTFAVDADTTALKVTARWGPLPAGGQRNDHDRQGEPEESLEAHTPPSHV